MPLAMAAAEPSTSSSLLAITISLRVPVRAPPGSSVFGTSTRLPLRHILARVKGIHPGRSRHGRELPLDESFQAPADRPIALHQKQRWHVRKPIGVAGWIAALFRVQQHREGETEFRAEFLRGLRVVLRHAVNRQRPRRAAAVNTLYVRQCHLAHWAS